MLSIQVKGMSCMHCVGSVTKALESIEDISEVQIDLATGQVTYQEKQPVDAEIVKAAIVATGFEVV